LANVFAREDLALKARPNRPINTPRPPIDVVEEVQCVCKMFEFVTIGVVEITHQENGLALGCR
jgi:hypothetical protein